MRTDRDLRQRLLREIRTAAEGVGAEAEILPLFPYLNQLPLVASVAEQFRVPSAAAIIAILQQAAKSLTGFEGERTRVPRSDIARCALGMGVYTGVPGLHARLRALGAQRKLQLSTMRGYWRNVAGLLVDQILILNPEEVTISGSSGPSSHWNYISERTHAFYMMTGRQPGRVIVTRELRAAADTLSKFSFPVGYPRDIREGVIEIKPLANCAMESSVLGGLGEQYTVLKLPRTRVGQTVRFSYEISVHSEMDDLPFLRHRGRVPGGPFLLEVQFDREQVPSAIWHFSEQPYDYDPTVAPDVDRLIMLSEFGFGGIEFAAEIPDRTLGIAWRWD